MLTQTFNIVDDNDKNPVVTYPEPININQNFMLTQTFNIVDDNDKYFLSS